VATPFRGGLDIRRPLSTSSLEPKRWSAGQAETDTGLTGAFERPSLAS
jgi:hypothetical protein